MQIVATRSEASIDGTKRLVTLHDVDHTCKLFDVSIEFRDTRLCRLFDMRDYPLNTIRGQAG